MPPDRRVKPAKCPASTKGNQRQAKPQTRGKEAAKSCAQVVAAATATGSQSICGGLRAHLARSPCHPTPSRCLCPGNPSPGHTKRQITMIAGASRGEWLRGPMHFGFGVLGTHKKGAGRLSPDEVAPSSRNVNRGIFARRRTPRTGSGGANPSIMAGAIPTRPLLTAISIDA